MKSTITVLLLLFSASAVKAVPVVPNFTQGAMTSYLLYPAKALVHKVPDHVDPKHACFVEPFSCSLHAVDLGDMPIIFIHIE